MKSSTSLPLGLSVFEEIDQATARLIRRALINYSAVRGGFASQKMLHSLAS